jgi:O-antigen/teichoic acid export membrane protein
MSRQAHDDRAAFRRTYQLALKLLFSVALPVAIAFTFMAFFLVNLLGGAEYLPDGAIALQLMIWSIPIGWMNSLTQYALIALDLQRRVTWAFVAGVSFNIITNLIFIPTYGYRAAALTTIASELVLLIGFWWLLRSATGKINPLVVIGRPLLAGAAMLAVLLVGWEVAPLLALVIGGLVYGGVLLALRPLTADEWVRLSPLLPSRLRRLRVT